MKLLFLALLFPVVAFSQQKKSYKEIRQEIKVDQAVADTMQFPVPFEYKYIDTVNLPKPVIYSKCLQWISAVLMGNVKRELQIQDSLTGKLVVTNIEARYDITQSLTIDVKDGKYRLTLDKYMYDAGNEYSKPVPIETRKDNSSNRLDKYYIYRQNQALFKSLQAYVRQNDDF